jgi:hypothetical protein
MLWAVCVLCTLCPDEETTAWVYAMAQSLVSLPPASLDCFALSQLHQVFVWCSVQEERRVAALGDARSFMDACRLAFESESVRPSVSQREVSETLRSMGLSVEDEARCPTSGFSIDMLVVQDALAAGSETSIRGRAWAVEFDGPWHFIDIASGAPRPKGRTLLKRRLLQLLGHALVSVPHWEWDACTSAGEREQYLRGKLKALETSDLCTPARRPVLPETYNAPPGAPAPGAAGARDAAGDLLHVLEDDEAGDLLHMLEDDEALARALQDEYDREHSDLRPQSHGTESFDAVSHGTESFDAVAGGKKLRKRRRQKRGQAKADAGDAVLHAPADLQAPLALDEAQAKENDSRQTPVGEEAADPTATSSCFKQREHEQQAVACAWSLTWSEVACVLLIALMICSGLWSAYICFEITGENVMAFLSVAFDAFNATFLADSALKPETISSQTCQNTECSSFCVRTNGHSEHSFTQCFNACSDGTSVYYRGRLSVSSMYAS